MSCKNDFSLLPYHSEINKVCIQTNKKTNTTHNLSVLNIRGLTAQLIGHRLRKSNSLYLQNPLKQALTYSERLQAKRF